MCGCAPSGHLDLQSSKANVVLFSCLFFFFFIVSSIGCSWPFMLKLISLNL